MKRKFRPATLLIAFASAGSGGAANAATSASLGSWFAPTEQLMMCISVNAFACMAPAGVPGTVSTDGSGGPCIRNK